MSNMIENGNYCVYVHTSPSGKMYVGQTGQKPEKRWRDDGAGYLHKNKSGEYKQPAFARAIIKYGWDNIGHEVVASNLTKEEADNFEKLLIEKLNTRDQKYGYNLKEGGSCGSLSEETRKKMSKSQTGKKLSEETRKKISESSMGKRLSEETKEKIRKAGIGKQCSEDFKKRMSRLKSGENNHNAKRVVQYDLNGKLIRIWDYIRQVEKEIGIIHGNISKCCKGEYKTAGGFIWRYADDEITNEYIALCNELHTCRNQKKSIVQYSLDNMFICYFDSVYEAGMKTGVDKGSISACCRGKNKTAGGFIWKYYEDIEEDIEKEVI